MTEKTEYEAAWAHGAAVTPRTFKIEDVPHVVLPPGCELASFQNLMPAPTRIKASPEFSDVEGFADYTNEFKQDGSRIFVDQSDWRFFTVFDAHAPGQPAWGDHCASLKMKESPEWRRFKAINGTAFAPMELAEFLEENLEYVAGPIEGADLLTMAQNLKVQLKGDLQIEHRTQSGLKQLLVKDDSTLQGKSGERTLEFPEKVDLALRIFENHETYPIQVFLRYRATKDAVKFWFKIPDPEGIQEQAFDQVILGVRAATGLRTLKGRYAGPMHK